MLEKIERRSLVLGLPEYFYKKFSKIFWDLKIAQLKDSALDGFGLA